MKKKICIGLVVILLPVIIVTLTLVGSGVTQQKSIEWVEANNGTVEFEMKSWADSIPFEKTKNLVGKQIISVSLRDAKVAGLMKLEVFLECEKLVIENCEITDYSSIGKLKNIKSLHFLNSNIKDLKFLKELTDLEYLELTNSSVDDLSALEDLQKLKVVNLKGTEVASIVPLKDLGQMEVLDLTATKVENILPLQTVKTLKNLNIGDTKVSQPQIIYLQKALQNCEITSTSEQL